MPTLDALADTELHEKAQEFADRFFQEWGGGVSDSQLNGLRQVAMQDPLKVAELAKRQADRYGKLGGDKPTAHFWRTVLLALGETGNERWSIKKFVEKLASQEFARAGITPSKNQLRAAMDEWRRRVIPLFMVSFCVHYQYRRSLRQS